jgi:hypothetical protein
MARTIQEIFDSIQAARAADAQLAAVLTSPSATAVHRLWAFVTATVHHTLETIFDRHRADVEAALARAKPGTAAWYAAQALLFQAGDTLVADDEGVHYLAGSTGAKIITRAAAIENDLTGKLFIKVAKDGPTPGTLASLSAAELVQVKAYYDRKGFAGVRKEIVSREADRLKLVANVYYDGSADVPTLQAAAEAAVRGYLAKLSGTSTDPTAAAADLNTDFDGVLYLAKIEDALQAVAKVKDVQLVQVSARAGATAPTLITRTYETQAGYIVTDELPGSTLADTLTFLPYK